MPASRRIRTATVSAVNGVARIRTVIRISPCWRRSSLGVSTTSRRPSLMIATWSQSSASASTLVVTMIVLPWFFRAWT